MDDSSEPIIKRLRPRRSANQSKPLTSEPQQPIIESPEKASPNSSLLYLNDDCLQEIFKGLDIIDLCNIANVCKRFRPIAKRIFSQRSDELVMKGQWASYEFRRILCTFGHLIKSIDTSKAFIRTIDGQHFNASGIVKYCTEKLEAISLKGMTINCDAFKLLFERLKCIKLFECNFIGNKNDLFKKCPNLETFSFHADFLDAGPNGDYDTPIDFVVQKFRKLKSLGFDCNYTGATTFFNLLKLNRHIKHIDIAAETEDQFIDAIVKYTKNLESFAIHSGDSGPEEQTLEGFLKLSKLKMLQKLNIESQCDEGYAEWVGPLMDAFANEKVPINHLELSDFQIGTDDLKSILKLKTLKFLFLNSIVKAVSDADLVPLATQLPLLEVLQLDFDYEVKAPITANGLVEMAKNGEQLQFMALNGVQNLKIDQKAFEDILTAVQSRHNGKKLTIEIVGCSNQTTIFDVPDNVQRAASTYLKIKYSEPLDE